jgi:alpha-beta hydrolase superfamily lysophospholipase
LAGTILKPTIKGKYPVVVLLPGSGANNRKTPGDYGKAFRLANSGIGALILDKRGTGASTGHWEQATIFDFATDGNAAVDYLAKRKDLPFSKIGIMGTSEGGWCAPIIANENKNVSFIVLNAGPAVGIHRQHMDFNRYWMKDKGVPQASIDSINRFSTFYFKSLYDNSLRSQIPAMAYPIEHNKKWWGNFLPAYDSAGIAWWTISILNQT